MSTGRQSETDELNRGQPVIWVGTGVDLILSVLKIVTGIIGNSAALLADGIHSLSDLASDALVLIAAHHGAQPADEQHPYGHERIETVATVILGLMLIAVAAGIAWDAAGRMMQAGAPLSPPEIWAIMVAALSLIVKEWLYHYTVAVARKIHSRLLEANAWHHRSDAISSLVVLAGIAGAMAGLPVLDAVAAFMVALMIAHIAWGLMSNSARELVDTAVDDETRQRIAALIAQTDGVVSLHMLRTRMMGGKILADAHIQVHPRLSVSEGHQIAETVGELLKNRIERIQDVTIHIDPENDEDARPNNHLPLRTPLLQELSGYWSHIPAAADIEEIKLHYLNGKVEVELLLPLPEGGAQEAGQIQAAFAEIASRHNQLSAVRVRYA